MIQHWRAYFSNGLKPPTCFISIAIKSHIGFSKFVLSFEKSDIFNPFGNLQNLDSQPDIVWLEFVTPPKLGGGGGFKYFLFSPVFGEDFQFD